MAEVNLPSSCLIGQGPLALSLHFTLSVIHGGSASSEQMGQSPSRRVKEPTGNLFISPSAFQTANSGPGFRTIEPKYIIHFHFFSFTSGSDRAIYRFCWALSPPSQKEKSLGGKRCSSAIQAERPLRLFRPQISSNLARCESGRPC